MRSAVEQHWDAARVPPCTLIGSDGSISLDWKHNTVAQLVRAELISEDELAEWTVFTTFRNRFDSLVSE